MLPEIEEKLRSCPSLPSPPIIAAQIINLVNDPEVDIKKFTALLRCDPALSSKILRIANSPVYPYPKKIENLHQALMILGLNATVSLALSFSLITSLKKSVGSGLDYGFFWKRALLSGTAARVIGITCRMVEVEELYLASLLQDLGMLVLDKAFPNLYASKDLNPKCHKSLLQREQDMLGITHAATGSWLLAQWNFPDRFRLAIAGSDDPDRVPSQDERARFVYCVNLSGKIAEVFLYKMESEALQVLQQQTESWLGLPSKVFLEILEKTKIHLAETEQLFETEIPTWTDPQTILDNAREALLFRNLQILKEVEELQIGTVAMEAQFNNLEESNRHDPLTGVLNRAYLDKSLESSFEQARAHDECLTLVFGDLDKFKSVNDTYGHHAGDVILQSAARTLISKVRTTDLVGRYGGEEFVLILPKTPAEAAHIVCNRILEAFRTTEHEVARDTQLTVTISLGIATHSPDKPFSNVQALLQASDEAVYFAKTHGGNQYMSYESIEPAALI
ncbi:MAG: GGDEF domain-containing protein [Nitrospirales bacterium]|nr:GGDEF domain-containing protein [Nitrospirales bacterium]